LVVRTIGANRQTCRPLLSRYSLFGPEIAFGAGLTCLDTRSRVPLEVKFRI
jgi:hypothetical protein